MSKKKVTEKKLAAWSLVRSNRFNEAVPLFKEICQTDKRDVESWHILGGLYGRLGLFEKASVCSRKALKLRPDFAEAHDNLGVALLELGKPKEAVLCHKRALRLKPGLCQTHYHLGNAYKEDGDYANAEKSYRDAIKINNNMAEAYNNLGNTLLQQDKPDEAEQAFIKAISIDPALRGAYENLGRAQKQQGNLPEAIISLGKGLQYDPDSSSIHLYLGLIYQELGSLDDSVLHLEKAIKIRPDFFEAYGALGSVLNKQGKLQKALDVYEHMLNLKPDSPDVIAAVASVHEKQGNYELAYQTLQTVTDKHPENVNIAISLGLLGRSIAIEEEALNRIEVLLNTPDVLDKDNQIQLHNLLGNIYDKAGEYEKAFVNFQKANELKAYHVNTLSYQQEFNALKEVFSHDFMDDIQTSDATSELPVFILGMPRSGTSLVEQILCSHPLVYGAGELEYIFDITRSLPEQCGLDLTYPECVRSLSKETINASAEAYLQQINENSNGAIRVTDKMPHNFLNLGLIQILFPNAKVIHCLRDPLDTCLSCYFQDFGARHPFSNELGNIGAYYKLYQSLMQHWKSVLRIPILNIRYEDLIHDPEKHSRTMIEFCGLEWDKGCLKPHKNKRIAKTASYYQVRQPIYERAAGRWKNYERFLGPLITTLGRDEI